MTAAYLVLIGVFAAYAAGAAAVLRVIRPRPERLSRRQRAIIRYYKGAPLA